MIGNFLNKLIQDIENKSKNNVIALELTCITCLIYQSEIKQKEIVTLRVCDVVGPDGIVKTAIKAKKAAQKSKDIPLTNDAKDALESYLGAIKSKNPAFVRKRKPLFPSYTTTRKLRRHWEKFGVSYNEIRQNGMMSHFTNRRSSGLPVCKIYMEGSMIFGITPRAYYAVVASKKLKSGQHVNDSRQIERLFTLLEAAESININDPGAKEDAARLLAEVGTALEKIKSAKTRNDHNVFYNIIMERLEPALTGPNT